MIIDNECITDVLLGRLVGRVYGGQGQLHEPRGLLAQRI